MSDQERLAMERAATILARPGHELVDEPEAMRLLFDSQAMCIAPLAIYVGGFGSYREAPNIPPLQVQVRHDQGQHLIETYDPVESLIENWMPLTHDGAQLVPDFTHALRDEEVAAFESAISALQFGLDRLQQHFAKRRAGALRVVEKIGYWQSCGGASERANTVDVAVAEPFLRGMRGCHE